jgi:hypothetical protein
MVEKVVNPARKVNDREIPETLYRKFPAKTVLRPDESTFREDESSEL